MEKITYEKPNKDFACIEFGDKRLTKRLEKSVSAMSQNTQESILSACGSRHDAKAFYALLSNDKFSYSKISESAKEATAKRIKASGITEVLLPQDTTDINLSGHKKTKGLGYSNQHTKGIQMHSCIAVTPDGIPLGLVAQQYETRATAKSDTSKREKQKLPIEEKESYRWLETTRKAIDVIPEGVTPVVICDREGDFYELYNEMLSLGTSFVVRVSQNRSTVNDVRSIQQLRQTPAYGEIDILIPRDSRQNNPARTVKMEVAYCQVTIIKPKHICTKAPDQLSLNFVRITEIGETDSAIEWLLATNVTITDVDCAMKVIEYYEQRWKIERFHYVLKSGCGAEKIQQREYEKIQALLLIYSVIAAYILALTYISRVYPDTPCNNFFEEDEWKILHRIIKRDTKPPTEPYSLKTAIAYLGELGSYKHSPSDGDYGVKSLWKGLIKLFDAIDLLHRLMGQV